MLPPRRKCLASRSLFFFSSRRRHTRCLSDWSSDVCSSDLSLPGLRIEVQLLYAQYPVGGGQRRVRENASQQRVSFMRGRFGLDEAVGELRGQGAVAVFLGGQGEKSGRGRVVGIHGQRLAEGFGITEGAGGHLDGQLAAEFVDGFGWENHGAWDGARA